MSEDVKNYLNKLVNQGGIMVAGSIPPKVNYESSTLHLNVRTYDADDQRLNRNLTEPPQNMVVGLEKLFLALKSIGLLKKAPIIPSKTANILRGREAVEEITFGTQEEGEITLSCKHRLGPLDVVIHSPLRAEEMNRTLEKAAAKGSSMSV